MSIPTTQLRVGENVSALTWTEVRSDQSHVMCDYLSLELP